VTQISASAKFTTTVEFHGQHGDTPADYTQLDVHMASVGFKRAAMNGSEQPPTRAEYEYVGGVLDEQTLMELAAWAVDRTLRERRRRGR